MLFVAIERLPFAFDRCAGKMHHRCNDCGVERIIPKLHRDVKINSHSPIERREIPSCIDAAIPKNQFTAVEPA